MTFDFAGVIDQSNTFFVAVGESFSGKFTYDPAQPDLDDQPDRGSYSSFGPAPRPFDMEFTVGSLSFHTDLGPGSSNWSVTNGDSDSFTFTGGAFVFPTGLSFRSGVVSLVDASGEAFSSDAFPTSLDLESFTEARFTGTLGVEDFGGVGGRFSGDIGTLEVALVPEPAAVLLAAAPLIAAASCQQSRRRIRCFAHSVV
jgi:hypothetical protein